MTETGPNQGGLWPCPSPKCGGSRVYFRDFNRRGNVFISCPDCGNEYCWNSRILMSKKVGMKDERSITMPDKTEKLYCETDQGQMDTFRTAGRKKPIAWFDCFGNLGFDTDLPCIPPYLRAKFDRWWRKQLSPAADATAKNDEPVPETVTRRIEVEITRPPEIQGPFQDLEDAIREHEYDICARTRATDMKVIAPAPKPETVTVEFNFVKDPNASGCATTIEALLKEYRKGMEHRIGATELTVKVKP